MAGKTVLILPFFQLKVDLYSYLSRLLSQDAGAICDLINNRNLLETWFPTDKAAIKQMALDFFFREKAKYRRLPDNEDFVYIDYVYVMDSNEYEINDSYFIKWNFESGDDKLPNLRELLGDGIVNKLDFNTETRINIQKFHQFLATTSRNDNKLFTNSFPFFDYVLFLNEDDSILTHVSLPLKK